MASQQSASGTPTRRSERPKAPVVYPTRPLTNKPRRKRPPKKIKSPLKTDEQIGRDFMDNLLAAVGPDSDNDGCSDHESSGLSDPPPPSPSPSADEDETEACISAAEFSPPTAEFESSKASKSQVTFSCRSGCGKPDNDAMIACDNHDIHRSGAAWYHFECVGVTRGTVPEGRYFCPPCRYEVEGGMDV